MHQPLPQRKPTREPTHEIVLFAESTGKEVMHNVISFSKNRNARALNIGNKSRTTSSHHVGANNDKANIASSKFFLNPRAMR
jgi:hypothetical protein